MDLIDLARTKYADFGVDVDETIEQLQDISLSIHCWQGDDVAGFEKPDAKLEGGGIFMNVGSAVVLPEVFLKALSFVRNSGNPLEDFSTAVFDFIHHYRPHQNVVKRPHGEKGKGFYFIGHHEILIPLLAASLKSQDLEVLS